MKHVTKVCVFLAFLIWQNSNAQTQKSQNLPDEKVQVNKEYDENGNLIRYDSIYSYSSSSGNLKMHSMKLDSLMKNFFPREFSNFFPEMDMKPQTSPFGFLNNNQHIDSIWKRNMELHQKMMEKYFKPRKSNEKQSQVFKRKKV